MAFKISSLEQLNQEYSRSIADPHSFWNEIAENFRWFKKWDEVLDCDFHEPRIKWFKGGVTNISYNCLDRHLLEDSCDAAMKDKVAIIFEPNDPHEKSRKITYKELHEQVSQFANLLIASGVKEGDRVCIYMPTIPESAVAMLACSRIGAIHCVVFAGFSAKALASRMQDAQATMLITADLLFRGDKSLKLSDIVADTPAQHAWPSFEIGSGIDLFGNNHRRDAA